MSNENTYDIIIIGSGPAGLSAALYAATARLKAATVEMNYMGSGQIAVSEQVDNYPGIMEINGFELGQKFREHAIKAGAEFYQEEACEIIRKNGFFTVRFKDGGFLDGKTVIYAAGTSYRKLDVSGAELKGVSYCAVCDGAFYKGKNVAVVGGGNTALEDVLHLSRIADKVYLIHRRDEFRANKTLQEKVRAVPNVQLVLNAKTIGIIGEKSVEAIEVLQSGKKRRIDVSGIFTAIGSVPNSGLLKGIVELDKSGYVVAGEDGITSVTGIFAAGDVRTKPLRQVVTAASDGANCVNSIEKYFSEAVRL